MPRFPRAERQKTIDAPVFKDPYGAGYAMGAPGRATQRLGGAIKGLGSQIEAAADEQDRNNLFDARINFMKTQNEIELGFTKSQDQITGDGGPWAAGTTAKINEQYNNFLSTVPTSKRAQRWSRLVVEQSRMRMLQRVEKARMGAFVDNRRKQLDSTYLTQIEPNVGSTVDTFSKSMEFIEGAIGETPGVPAQVRNKWLNDYRTRVLDKWLQNDPATAPDRLKELQEKIRSGEISFGMAKPTAAPIKTDLTAYSPQAGGDRMEGDYRAARAGPDQNPKDAKTWRVVTLSDSKGYVTLAGPKSAAGKRFMIPKISYYKPGTNEIVTRTNVIGVVHDYGRAFDGAPEGRYDVAVGRDLSDPEMYRNHALWKKEGVQFIPLGKGDTGERGPTELTPKQQSAVRGVSKNVVTLFGNLQALFGKTLRVTSGHRSPLKNASVGGARNSQHLSGRALDISVRGMPTEERIRLIRIASSLGFTGIGVYENSIHVDDGRRRSWGKDYGRGSVPSWAEGTIKEHLSGKIKESPGTQVAGGGSDFNSWFMRRVTPKVMKTLERNADAAERRAERDQAKELVETKKRVIREMYDVVADPEMQLAEKLEVLESTRDLMDGERYLRFKAALTKQRPLKSDRDLIRYVARLKKDNPALAIRELKLGLLENKVSVADMQKHLPALERQVEGTGGNKSPIPRNAWDIYDKVRASLLKDQGGKENDALEEWGQNMLLDLHEYIVTEHGLGRLKTAELEKYAKALFRDRDQFKVDADIDNTPPTALIPGTDKSEYTAEQLTEAATELYRRSKENPGDPQLAKDAALLRRWMKITKMRYALEGLKWTDPKTSAQQGQPEKPSTQVSEYQSSRSGRINSSLDNLDLRTPADMAAGSKNLDPQAVIEGMTAPEVGALDAVKWEWNGQMISLLDILEARGLSPQGWFGLPVQTQQQVFDQIRSYMQSVGAVTTQGILDQFQSVIQSIGAGAASVGRPVGKGLSGAMKSISGKGQTAPEDDVSPDAAREVLRKNLVNQMLEQNVPAKP